MGLKRERVVVVTGGSRGAGKGIAIALGATGATVYVTGRTRSGRTRSGRTRSGRTRSGRSGDEGQAALPGSVEETADAVTAAGGRGIPMYCDHADDGQVEQLFGRVREEHGRLDILVNNATTIHDALTRAGPFWDKPLALADILDVGLRSHYAASWFAAPLLIANGEGLVVNTSSFGGRVYMHGPAYGAGKAGVDKMAHDMAVDFSPYGVAVVAVWMGLLSTERTRRVFAADPDKYGGMADTAESPELTGRVIDALALDPGLMGRSGKVWIGAELALEYGLTDEGGRQPQSPRAFFGDTTTFGDAVVE